MSIAIISRHAPHGTAQGREALDAACAAAALSDGVGFFVCGDGVWQWLPDQSPELILQRNYFKTLGLLALYEVPVWMCLDSLIQRGIDPAVLPDSVAIVSRLQWGDALRRYRRQLVF